MTAFSDETVLKRNEVLSFDDGLLTIKISGHGDGDGWGSIAFHERQIEIDADGFHVAEIPPSELRALRDFLNRIIPAALSASPVAQEPVATKATQQASADFLHEEMIKLGSPLTYTACLTLTKRITDTNTLAWAGEVNKLCTEIGSLKNEIAALKSAATPPATPAGLGADEIARIIEPEAYRLDTLIDDPNIQDIRKEWAREKANAILALLSRAGDQSNSTQKDGSR